MWWEGFEGWGVELGEWLEFEVEVEVEVSSEVGGGDAARRALREWMEGAVEGGG